MSISNPEPPPDAGQGLTIDQNGNTDLNGQPIIADNVGNVEEAGETVESDQPGPNE